MPRVSKQLAQENRKNIENISSQLIRDKGFSVSVSDLMKAVGLTHGGFYKHFQNKDELIDIACKDTFRQSEQKWNSIIAETGSEQEALNLIFTRYLSEKNLADPGKSCPLSSLSMDVAREEEGKAVKQTFHQGVETLLKILTTLNDPKHENTQLSEQAIIQLSLLSGALTLARSVDHDLALNILDTVKHFLIQSQTTE
ncbi:TetR/AcrR family transcriptional regulator [Acinetobacter wuhouensis]|uniref:TetR/AcrR family transcriptional regulator n=1 Tax=Acinetobacter wuhouensis TaxID=1879050 RepID=A0A4Q7AP28_9GAMM|nr:TetR/AcrR family transcriptional regulator [Acinetobacter wuhouensis]RZG46732.1 TetR/AcrR family transcriptional regulator [Acinetobacter wuhouensis]RZG71694.1 TetR/AcrR family transcriptional regulator [Acinetobacter wuhouensis]